MTFTSGIGVNTRWLGWGCGFVDFDNDGWLDIFLVNGHVYPEVEKLTTEAGYPQRKVLYRNRATARSKTSPSRSAGRSGADGESRHAPSAISTTTATSTS